MILSRLRRAGRDYKNLHKNSLYKRKSYVVNEVWIVSEISPSDFARFGTLRINETMQCQQILATLQSKKSKLSHCKAVHKAHTRERKKRCELTMVCLLLSKPSQTTIKTRNFRPQRLWCIIYFLILGKHKRTENVSQGTGLNLTHRATR